MVNRMLQAALATQDASLDRDALARVARPMPVAEPKPRTPEQQRIAARDSARRDSLKAPPPPKAEPLPGPARIVVDLPLTTDSGAARSSAARRAAAEGELRPIPSVYGLDVRQAARTLYAAGFQVRVVQGAEVRTRPAAGAVLRTGSTVQLEMPRR
jgi:cell division protein FtsI (penicillin-binding protein 3)